MKKWKHVHWRRTIRLNLLALEARLTPTVPNSPVIIEPFGEGQITGTFDINMQTDPSQYFDADGHAWQATQWRIRETASLGVVWQTGFLSSPPLTFYRVDFSDGSFVGNLAGKTELNYSTNYQLVVNYRDSNSEVSADAVRNFTTTGASTPVPGAGTWLVRPGYVVEPVQSGLRLPVNIAFVPNPGTDPDDPLYYVNELYGSIQVVRRDGTRQTFATGLLDYNPQGPISGSGEQGLTGLAVERDSINPDIYHLYVGMLWDNGSPPGAPNHYPKVERIDSTAGGLTMASRTVLLNMQPETQGQSHQISNITIGPDGKLYVHMGDGFDSSTALNLDMYRGKVLRMNKNGTPVATGDPAGANPFYDATNGINSRDYIFTYGHRNPFGGAWRAADGRQWIVENGNSLDRMVDLVSGSSYGWAGNDSTHIQFSKFIWNPSTAPVNIDFVESTKFGGSMFPAEAFGHAFVTLSGSTYAPGVQQRAKSIVEFPDLDTLDVNGKLLVQPVNLIKYNGTGYASVVGLAAGPDGLYFSDLYEDTGAGGATGVGANVYRVRYVGNSGGAIPTVATPAAATPNPVILGSTTQLSVLGADDGGENNLTYTWAALGSPPGAVQFSSNGSNAAKNTTATFFVNGTYNLFVNIKDAGGQSAFSSIIVTVSSFLTETGNGVNGQYWSNIDFTGTTMTRIDPTIDFDWGNGGPGTVGTDTFSARWTGFVVPRFTQTYTFYTTTDDGVRLWVNNLTTPLIDHFVNQSPTTWTGTIALTAGTIYQIRMDYFENGGTALAKLEWSSPSQPREVVPQGRLYSTMPTIPAAPTALILASPSSQQMNLSWTQNSANESGFRIERSLNGSTFALVATVPANVTAFNDTGLIPGTLYYYRVRSTNPAGDSGFAASNLPTRPGVPQGLATMPGNGQVQLNWNAVIGATSYRVYRNTTPGQPLGSPLVTGLVNPMYTDNSVTNGIIYYYRVTAVNSAGEGLPSEETDATPNAPNPPAVTTSQVNAGDTQRSLVTQVSFTFNALVNFGTGAFQLTNLLGDPIAGVALNVNSQNVGGVTVATLTFTGAAIINGSLPDGRYRITLVASQVTNQVAPFSAMSANHVFELHRLFGDANGSASVTSEDFATFRTFFGLGPSIFDFDGDGQTNSNDFAEFRKRFGLMI